MFQAYNPYSKHLSLGLLSHFTGEDNSYQAVGLIHLSTFGVQICSFNHSDVGLWGSGFRLLPQQSPSALLSRSLRPPTHPTSLPSRERTSIHSEVLLNMSFYFILDSLRGGPILFQG